MSSVTDDRPCQRRRGEKDRQHGRNLMGRLIVLGAVLCAVPIAFGGDGATPRDSFEEQLLLEAVSPTHILVSVHFAQRHSPIMSDVSTFPQAVRNVALMAPMNELSLDLTRGRWDYAAWGRPNAVVHPSGAVASVVWRDPAVHARGWTRLMHRLSGLLCTSLNLVSKPDAALMRHWPADEPLNDLEMQHTTESARTGRHVAWLPRETACTENLTPWLKLLPCRGAAGLAGLLADRGLIFGGDYHSLALRIEVHGSLLDRESSLVLTQTFSAVLQLPKNPRSQPDALEHTLVGLALSDLLPVATDFVPCSASSRADVLSACQPGPSHVLLPHGAPAIASLPLTCSQPPPTQSPLSLRSSLSGQGLSAATLRVSVRVAPGLSGKIGPAACWPPQLRPWQGKLNHARLCSLKGRVLCLELWVPWVLQLWLHTLRLTVNDQALDKSELVFWQQVTPACDRRRPFLLSTCLRLPDGAKSVLLAWRASRAFLTLAEHPPDAHRGWDVPPARLWYSPSPSSKGASQAELGPDHNSCWPHRLEEVLGTGLLVQLPTADVAMPYNVICLTSTVLAVFVGATINVLLSRRMHHWPGHD